MPIRIAKRAIVVLAAMTALLIFATGQAQAANTFLILNDIDGNQLGTMTHIDVETDQFKVCDTNSDGASVTGRLYNNTFVILKVTDGGDAGCNTETFNVKVGEFYTMQLCWNGTDFRPPCKSEGFIE
ncbi:hypothetical protein [Glycomyces albidus]|uniref:Uncharacterized protein n=1 Tax=Glycomyces albidus TaxID=2656774 RepID=A0A6L5GBH0_9ACTN|nr:hypothetical protein [Glycomyces albidus]MQM27042.1 hypothetical protein [Glycomyces albidus]